MHKTLSSSPRAFESHWKNNVPHQKLADNKLSKVWQSGKKLVVGGSENGKKKKEKKSYTSEKSDKTTWTRSLVCRKGYVDFKIK